MRQRTETYNLINEIATGGRSRVSLKGLAKSARILANHPNRPTMTSIYERKMIAAQEDGDESRASTCLTLLLLSELQTSDLIRAEQVFKARAKFQLA